MTTVIDHKGIAAIIGTSRLVVPKHQRPFEWTKDHVGELLDDLDGAFQRAKEEYFLGSIVVVITPANERHQVLDGQQRLASVSLLLASIADEFERRNEPNAATAVRQLLASYDIDQGAHSAHLRLNQEDDPYFRTLLQKEYEEPELSAPESHRLLLGTRRQTLAWVRTKTADDKAALGWLKDFTKYLRESVRVIYFGVPDDSNAYLIFETLNDRGLDLSIADLLKNYMLGRSGEDLDNVLTLWTQTLATLKAFGYEKDFTVFLRHYWSSRYEVAREKELYRRVKRRITSAATVLDFANDLAKNSYFYTALVTPEHEYWSSASEITRERLRTLAVLGLEQYRPMLLAALAHFEVKDVETVVAMLEAWNVRLVIVGGLGGGVMEARYAELGRAIRDGEIKNVKELSARAQQFVPSDIEFGSQFAVATVSKVALARYYLNKLEVASHGKTQAEKVPSPLLTLEHVLAERPLSNWPQFSDEERALYTRRLGNMTLLTHKVNSDLKSAPFTEKQKIYAASTLSITKSISEFPQWNVESIETRQVQLADLAVKAWPLGK